MGASSASGWLFGCGLTHHAQACMDTLQPSQHPHPCPVHACALAVQVAEEIYVDVARACTENNLLKFSAKGYLLQAGICALCYASDDDVAIKLEQYRWVKEGGVGCRPPHSRLLCASNHDAPAPYQLATAQLS